MKKETIDKIPIWVRLMGLGQVLEKECTNKNCRHGGKSIEG